jgi:hypothetical protein
MTALIAFVCVEIIAFLGLTAGHCIRAYYQKRCRPSVAIAISQRGFAASLSRALVIRR